MTNVNTGYLKEKVNKKYSEESDSIEEQKKETSILADDINFDMIICLSFFYLCIAGHFSTLSGDILFLVIAVLVSRYISNLLEKNKIKEIDTHTVRFTAFLEEISPVLSYNDFIPIGTSNYIENELEKITNKEEQGILYAWYFEPIIHVICLVIGVLFLLTMQASFFRAGMYSVLFAYYTAKLVIAIKDIRTL